MVRRAATDKMSARSRVRGGLWSTLVIAGGTTALLVWTMGASDPYWRLMRVAEVSAPFDGGAAPAERVPVGGPLDAPSTVATPGTRAMAAEDPAAAPLALALPVPDTSLAVAPDHGRLPLGDVDTEENTAAAPDAPPLGPSPVPLPSPRAFAAAEGPQLYRDDGPSPVEAPLPPSPLALAASAETEAALRLTARDRVEVQRRLKLAGFDPGPGDGVFGPRTRRAIADFEAAWGYPPTGYLDERVMAELHARTDEAYAALQRRLAASSVRAPERAPLPASRMATANKTCRRDSRGRIIENQSLACDLKGLKEGFLSLGRTVFGRRDEAHGPLGGGETPGAADSGALQH